jgi:hypothetical protein
VSAWPSNLVWQQLFLAVILRIDGIVFLSVSAQGYCYRSKGKQSVIDKRN